MPKSVFRFASIKVALRVRECERQVNACREEAHVERLPARQAVTVAVRSNPTIVSSR